MIVNTTTQHGQTFHLIAATVAIFALFGGIIAAVVGLVAIAASSPVLALTVGLSVIVVAVVMAAILVTPSRPRR